MKITVSSSNPLNKKSPCLILAIPDDGSLGGLAADIDHASGGLLSALHKSGDIRSGRGKCLMLYRVPGIAAERLLLVGAGAAKKLDAAAWRKACGAVAAELHEAGVTSASLALQTVPGEQLDSEAAARQFCEALGDWNYRYRAAGKGKAAGKHKPVTAVTLLVAANKHRRAARRGADIAIAVARGKQVAKDLSNAPGNTCTPSWLARESRKLAQQYGLKFSALNEKQMRELRMGSLLSVSRGSREPARLIVMEYRGAKKRGAKPVVLVGKGLTFDAGGISIKPSAKMDEMKYDMCGAASVIGAVVAVAELALPINVVGVVPSSENLPDGAANKPGDVVASMSGQTIEILNTDAEGRLILCDALTYSKRFKPRAVIDVATLTGACVVALGAHASGLMANDQPLADALIEAGQQSLDRVWQLPLWDDYQSQLDSNFADIANIGSGPGAGTITAGCFLSRFTKGFKWAHLDIAGTAWIGGKRKGATGRVVPLLTQYLIGAAK